MKRSLFATVFALLLPASAFADAPTPAPSSIPASVTAPAVQAPVTLQTCHMEYPQLSIGLLPIGKGVGPLDVTFRNDGQKKATEVRVDADLDGHDLIVVDKGTFSPDTEIKHRFATFSGGLHFLVSREPQPKCAVIQVLYDDGTSWSAPVADSGVPQLFDVLTGSWKCSTAAGSAVATDFTVLPSGGVDQQMNWTDANGKPGGSWDQSFTYDSNAKQWNVKNIGSNDWVFTGTTNGADGNVVLVSGSQVEGKTTVAVRERFTFSLPNGYTHSWEEQASDGTWKPTSYADCVRVVASGPA